MQLSLNEVETTVTKAAQGCGLDFGIAAEIGAAAGWLCARGLDGVSAAVAVLSAGPDPRTIVDRLRLDTVDLVVAKGSPLPAVGCSSPLMLRALAARAGCSVQLDRSGVEPGGTWVVGPCRPAQVETVEAATVAVIPEWEQLLAWAALTHVTSSERSRIAGAGAGLTDND